MKFKTKGQAYYDQATTESEECNFAPNLLIHLCIGWSKCITSRILRRTDVVRHIFRFLMTRAPTAWREH